MKAWVIAFIGSAVFLLGAAATNGGQGGPPGAPSALVEGSVGCSPYQGGVSLYLYFDLVFGVETPQYPGQLSGQGAGTCEEIVAALGAEIPSPLCASGTGGYAPSEGFRFVCSGLERDVIEAVGGLTKVIIALP